MELQHYLETHFLDENTLCLQAGVPIASLHQWQHLQLMPQPSYTLSLNLQCESFFGHHTDNRTLKYYPKAYIGWLSWLENNDNPELNALVHFAERYHKRTAELFAEQLVPSRYITSSDRLNKKQLDQHIREEWKHFLAGTYGLCTSTGLPEQIAEKEMCIAVIEQLLQANAQDSVHLHLAVDRLDTASALFAPHEREKSSRKRYIDDIRRLHPK